MKQYIASYQNSKDECWDIIFNANSYKEARRDALLKQKEMGKLWSLRLKKTTKS